jgi:carboxylesterase
MTSPILPGADAWSHDGAGPHGVVVVHGFTGNPSSMRGLAEAFAGAGYHVELPRLPGHGTVVEDMLTTRWADWAGEAEAAYQRVRQRSERVVVAGLSMGGAPVLPGIGSDIADPDVTESAYSGTPVEPLLSMLLDGVEPLSKEYPAMGMPLLLMNSPQDHVVEPAHAEFLAEHYGGPLERITLERSYHVATQDYDKELIIESALAFAARVLTHA